MSLRPPVADDTALLVAGQDRQSRRFIGEGSSDPQPSAVVCDSGGQVVGWIDYDAERDWLLRGEVNIGYSIFPPHRRRGYAGRALSLFLDWLAADIDITTATLLIDSANVSSIAVAHRCDFEQFLGVEGQLLFKRVLR